MANKKSDGERKKMKKRKKEKATDVGLQDSLGRLLAELGSGAPEEVIKQRNVASADDQHFVDGYYTACARFKSEHLVGQALRRCAAIPCICLSDIGIEPAKCGVTKFCAKYRNAYKTMDELQHGVESYMSKHDAIQNEKKRNLKRMANVPDEEGWITVTKTHYKRLPPAIVVRNKEDLRKLSKKKKRVVCITYKFIVTPTPVSTKIVLIDSKLPIATRRFLAP
ncbi:unnamed protein product [Gongylonema pulchrum]|uniref:RRP7 domain-containing protein n=1 Tax=Gongylonema pulchrum TaxID=637853 RepID=A0A183DQC2_9BILA|nr:unnamed protein product [Gongylonema pulchrum]